MLGLKLKHVSKRSHRSLSKIGLTWLSKWVHSYVIHCDGDSHHIIVLPGKHVLAPEVPLRFCENWFSILRNVFWSAKTNSKCLIIKETLQGIISKFVVSTMPFVSITNKLGPGAWARIVLTVSLQWCHNEHDGVSNHQPHGCLLNRLFRRSSKKHQSPASLAFVRGIHRWLVNSLHKGPVTQKMFPFDDVIIFQSCIYMRLTLEGSTLLVPFR